jgi:hypothetical protein
LFQQQIVNFIAMAMAFDNGRLAIQLTDQAVVAKLALPAPRRMVPPRSLFSVRTSIAFFITPFGNERTTGTYSLAQIPSSWRFPFQLRCEQTDQRNLHPQADAQIWNIVFTRVACSGDLALHRDSRNRQGSE